MYITIIVAFILTVMIMSGNVLIGYSSQNASVNLVNPETMKKVTGSIAPFAIMAQPDSTLFLILPIIFVLAATDFSSSAIKNTLSGGVSRIKYYFSKVILGFCFAFIITFFNVIVGIIVATAINSFGGIFDGAYILSVLKPYLGQLLLFFAAVCIGNAIVFISQKGAVLNSVYIAFFYGMSLAFFIITTSIPSWANINNLNFNTNLQILSAMNQLRVSDIIRALSIGMFWIITSTVLGIIIFRKSEIK